MPEGPHSSSINPSFAHCIVQLGEALPGLTASLLPPPTSAPGAPDASSFSSSPAGPPSSPASPRPDNHASASTNAGISSSAIQLILRKKIADDQPLAAAPPAAPEPLMGPRVGPATVPMRIDARNAAAVRLRVGGQLPAEGQLGPGAEVKVGRDKG